MLRFALDDPLDIIVFITNRCNLSCNTCPFTHNSPYSPPPDVPDLPVDMFKVILAEHRGASVIGVVGGEPLLHPELPQLIRLAAEFRIIVNLSTNGLLLTQSVIEQLLELPLGFLNISLDAADAADYKRMRGGSEAVYAKILANARLFNDLRRQKNSGIKFVLSYVTDEHNFRRIPEFTGLAAQIGADRVFCQNLLPYQCSNITRISSSIPDTPEYRSLLQNMKFPEGIEVIPPVLTPVAGNSRAVRCHHPFRMLAFDGGGNLSPCCVIPPHPKYGNLGHDPLEWRRGQALQKIRMQMTRGDDAFEDICLECW